MATFGYTSQGASEAVVASVSLENPVGVLGTLSVTAYTLDSMSFYARRTMADKSLSGQVYSGSAGSRGSSLYTTVSADITLLSMTWYTRNFSSPPSNVSANTYWLQANIAAEGGGTGSGFIAYDTGGASNTGYVLNDLGVPTYNTNQYSIYATYTQTSTLDIDTSDTITITEDVSPKPTLRISISDSITIEDALPYYHLEEILVTEDVSVSVSEASTVITVSVSEDITLTEDTLVSIPYLPITVNDAITITEDSITLVRQLVIDTSDNVTITDTGNATLLLSMLSLGVSDDITLTENISFLIPIRLWSEITGVEILL